MKVICFGDSNTYGYDPCFFFGGRYGAENRWVDLMGAQMGWTVRNDGLNGRCIPRMETRFPEDTDLLVIMLGTNDLLQGACAEQTAVRMESFLRSLTMRPEKILLIAPPPLERGEWVTVETVISASRDLADRYQAIAKRIGSRFADAGAWGVSLAYDGVHFDEAGHRAFAKGLCAYLKDYC